MRVTSDGYFHYQGELTTYEGKYLPHWDVDDGIYFVTFRLADSLPADETDRFRKRLAELADDHTDDEVAEFACQLYLESIDTRLDDHGGACHLEREPVATLVRDAIRHFDGERYELFTWVLMPNHVHVVFRRHVDYPLGEVVGGWKSYTAQQAREFVEFGDHFWQRDYFDRLIRSEEEFRRICRYVWKNPDNAGLDDWPWKGIERGP